MAFAALVSLAQTIDQILNHTQYSLSVDNKQRIIAIHEYAHFLEAFLEYFSEKAKNLEGRLREVANKAEDVLENLMWQEIHWRIDVEFEGQLRRVSEQIDSIAGEVMEIKKNFSEDVQFGADSSSSAASSSSRLGKDVDVMVGFDEDLLAIKSRLCGGSSKLQVVPIVGMAGIGKTTLARNAYNDPFVMGYFHIRAWVTVSQDYSAKEIISSLLASMKDSIKESEEEQVYKSLKGRRYLVVMDDVWNTEAWDVVRNLLPDDDNGSRIILTTRLSDVAAYPDSCTRSHEMVFMDVDQSWNLLQQRVFLGQDCPPELQNIGKMIARKCKGLPLAIVTVAGLLSVVNKTPTSWKEIAVKVNSDDGQIDEILSLSYTHLPHHLRACFLYLGGFREDREIRVSKLIKLWVAEGFLKYQNEHKSLEEEAEEYLEDLVKRNLVLVDERKSNGKIKSCSLHDLMRDLCIRKAKEEKFLLHPSHDVERSMQLHRRVVISSLADLGSLDGSSIRTIIMHSRRSYVEVDLLASVRLLRVLDSDSDSEYTSESTLSAHLFEQFHLRYLAIDLVLSSVSSAISNFQNLQTLIIKESRGRLFGVHDKYLPQEIWRMQQLRHVVFCGRLHDPKGTTPLQKLQTLTVVSHYICSSEETVKMVSNVKKLGVCCSDYHPGTTYLNNLVYLHQLQNLSLYSPFMLHLRKGGFAFPKTLIKLTLDQIFIPWEDFTVVGSLPNLRVLKLREGFWGKGRRTWRKNEGEFVELEFLLIRTPKLMHWITECSHFPRLKSLLLHSCHSLTHIPHDFGEIPTLELIEVKGQKYLGRLAKRIQEEQQNLGNYSLQVRHITN